MCPEIDIHQHLWPEPLLSALSLRHEPPMLVRRGAGWALRLVGEPEGPVDLADHDPDARAALVRADGLDRALVVPSTPLGIEALPAGEAEPLLAAYHEGVRALPDEFGAWAAVGLAAPDPVELARLLDAGFVRRLRRRRGGRRAPRGWSGLAPCSRRSSAAASRCSCIRAPHRRRSLPGCRTGGPR